jgi:indole-3-glycerol phosphate synthase
MPSLEKRLSSARREVEQRRAARPLGDLEAAVAHLRPIRPFTEAASGEEIDFVLRLKEADGALLETAESLEVAGLAASIGQLPSLAGLTAMPLLLTDVIVDAYQLYESRLAGAGGVVLIAAAFDDEDQRDHMAELYAQAGSIGLDVIVEVADEQEIEDVLDLLDPDSFLVRNRSEDGGAVDFERTFSLLEEVPAGKVVVSQGGVRERDEVEALERAGVDAVILGPWAAAGDLADTLRVLRGESR